MTSTDCVEPVLRSIAKAERHIRSEYGTKMVGVMDTIGTHPRFAMMLQPGKVTVLSGRPAIDEMYKASVANAAPQASRLLSQRATDWYVFIENVPTRLWIADGVMRTVQTVTMFTTDDEHGITGEYAWQRHYPPHDPSDTDDALVPLPDRALANLKLHQDLLDAMASGDRGAFQALLDPACIWAQRDYRNDIEGGRIIELQGAAAAAGHMAQWHEALGPLHVSVLNRHVTDWFVFSEELWIVRAAGGDLVQCRTASVYAINEAGLVEAVLGFGKDPEALSPSAADKMGIAFWPEGVGPDTASQAGYPGD